MKISNNFIFIVLGVAAIAGITAWLWSQWPAWMEAREWPEELPLQGGQAFAERVLIDVPFYSQNDPRWGRDSLASTPQNLAREGCAVAAAAMALIPYGSSLDPGELNAQLRKREGGFTPQGWIYWEAAAAEAGARVQAVYEGPADYRRIDRELSRGNPCIVRLRLPNGMMHFVLAVGKEGREYLVLDPALPAESGPVPLSEVGGVMTGLRVYMEQMPFWARHFIVPVPES